METYLEGNDNINIVDDMSGLDLTMGSFMGKKRGVGAAGSGIGGFQQDDPAEVIALAKKVLKENPSFEQGYTILHNALWQDERYSELVVEAIKAWKKYKCKTTLSHMCWALLILGVSEWGRELWDKGKGTLTDMDKLVEEGYLRRERHLEEGKKILSGIADNRARSCMGTVALCLRESPMHYWLEEWAVILDKPSHSLPKWNGQVSEGTRVLVDCNAGIGDFFFMGRYLDMVTKYITERGGEVFIHTKKKMGWMLSACDFVGTGEKQARIIRGEDASAVLFDNVCTCYAEGLIMPTHMYMDWSDVRDAEGVRADWLHFMKDMGGSGKKRGKKYMLMWKTFDGNPDSLWRDMPLTYVAELLEVFASLGLEEKGWGWIVSDHNLNGVEKALLARYDNVEVRSMDKMYSFGDTVECLTGVTIKNGKTVAAEGDEIECAGIISVDTSLANLGGSLGVETHVMLAHTPEWRWGLENDTTDMFPSCILHRQKTDGEWRDVILSVKNWLKANVL